MFPKVKSWSKISLSSHTFKTPLHSFLVVSSNLVRNAITFRSYYFTPLKNERTTSPKWLRAELKCNDLKLVPENISVFVTKLLRINLVIPEGCSLYSVLRKFVITNSFTDVLLHPPARHNNFTILFLWEKYCKKHRGSK